jgi:Uma2 family endonuclease
VVVQPVKLTQVAPKHKKWVSEAEYWDKYYNDSDRCYEWNNGYLEKKPMPDHASFLMYEWFINLLNEYLKAHPIAKIMGLDMAFRLALPRKTAIRKPDLGVVRHDNPIPLATWDQSYHGIFDICIESLSYSKASEEKRDTVTKKREYAKGGVSEYYILDAREQKTAFYYLTARGKYVRITPLDKEVICSSVLPGFQFRLSDLTRQPSIQKMSQDPVYRGFVGLEWQVAQRQQQETEQWALAEARRAEQEARRAEQEAHRAEQEAHRAEQEARRAEQAEQRAVAVEQRAVAVEQRALAAEAEIARLKELLAK